MASQQNENGTHPSYLNIKSLNDL